MTILHYQIIFYRNTLKEYSANVTSTICLLTLKKNRLLRSIKCGYYQSSERFDSFSNLFFLGSCKSKCYDMPLRPLCCRLFSIKKRFGKVGNLKQQKLERDKGSSTNDVT